MSGCFRSLPPRGLPIQLLLTLRSCAGEVMRWLAGPSTTGGTESTPPGTQMQSMQPTACTAFWVPTRCIHYTAGTPGRARHYANMRLVGSAKKDRGQ